MGGGLLHFTAYDRMLAQKRPGGQSPEMGGVNSQSGDFVGTTPCGCPAPVVVLTGDSFQFKSRLLAVIPAHAGMTIKSEFTRSRASNFPKRGVRPVAAFHRDRATNPVWIAPLSPQPPDSVDPEGHLWNLGISRRVRGVLLTIPAKAGRHPDFIARVARPEPFPGGRPH